MHVVKPTRRPSAGPESSVSSKEGVEPLVDTAEMARVLGIGRTLAMQLLRAREIPCVRIGRAVRIRPADIRAWIDRRVK